MTKCSKLTDLGRRQFLASASRLSAGVAVASVLTTEGTAAPSAALVRYPKNRLANIAELKVGEPLDISYPDRDAPGVLIRLGSRVPTGIGPEGDIVGFITLCPHKGYPLTYSAEDKSMNCPGHYTRFDCEKGGLQIWGHATQNLPQYFLSIDGKGDIYAEGVDELIYGRLSNII